MQPMAAHKGYGLAILVDLLTAILSNGCTSMEGQISSWCFEMERPNNVCHAFLAIDPQVFPVGCVASLLEYLRWLELCETLRRRKTPPGFSRREKLNGLGIAALNKRGYLFPVILK